ncbi:MAG TPA: CAP domain-containing protein [Armatimonadota bacterium]|jgi:uncharacterized protein YkwD|nr:CAP domain-containing protein [Armatimonadota bacterium]
MSTFRRSIQPSILALVLALTSATPALTARSRPNPPSRLVAQELPGENLASVERELVALIARERAERGLARLDVDVVLIEAARSHSQEMGDKGYFDHYSPTPGRRSPMERYLRASRGSGRGVAVGENIYFSSEVSAQGAHRAFMNSRGHRDNILGRNWRRVGIGIHANADGEFWVTEMFAG